MTATVAQPNPVVGDSLSHGTESVAVAGFGSVIVAGVDNGSGAAFSFLENLSFLLLAHHAGCDAR